MGVAWPKTNKTHKLPRLIWAAKSSRGANFFSSLPFSHVTRLIRRANHATIALAWPRTVKTNNMPRLIWLAKSSRCANFFHPRHFPRYTSFTASQPRKNGRCLAKNSQNTQFALFDLGCKKFARRELFSSQPFSTLHVFYGPPTTQKWPLPGQNQSKHTICHFNLGCKKFARRELFSSHTFPTLYVFYGPPTTQKWPLPGQNQSKHTSCHV